MTQVAGFDQITLDYTCVATQNYPSLFLQQQERIALKLTRNCNASAGSITVCYSWKTHSNLKNLI